MEVSEQISTAQMVLLLTTIGLTLVALVALLCRIIPLKRHYKRNSAMDSADGDGSLPKAAVIVFANDDADALAEMLPAVLSQDYAPGYEVIVVNDGESIDVRIVAEGLMMTHPNLYFTAAPDGARNLSRKKLALTLGIKAAKSPVVVHTTSWTRIPSRMWLQGIMRHFDPDGAVDVVIGYAAAPTYDDREFGSRARSFDSAADALGWLAPAVCGNPWRGSEHNLAYRRDLFFANKGFSQHLNLHDGDDDIFVSEIARGYNTMVEISDGTVVEVPGNNSRRALHDRLSRRRFTKRYIPAHPRMAGTLYTLLYFIAPMPLAAVPFVGPLTPWMWGALGVALLCWYGTGLCWNAVMPVLRGRKFMLSTPIWAFTRPLRIGARTVRSLLRHTKRYTWE